jgi:hypothetical protein
LKLIDKLNEFWDELLACMHAADLVSPVNTI